MLALFWLKRFGIVSFLKVGYKIVDVPSESGKELHTHYLRYTKDPST